MKPSLNSLLNLQTHRPDLFANSEAFQETILVVTEKSFVFLFSYFRLEKNKGIGVDNIHYLYDGLWNMKPVR